MGIALLGALLAVGSPQTASALGYPVWTSRIDQHRQGWNAAELTFTPASMGSGTTFGRKALWTLPTGSGQLVAQLLYAPLVPLPTGVTKDLIIAATTRDQLYFYDANNFSDTPPPVPPGGAGALLFHIDLTLGSSDPQYPGGTAPACNYLNDGGQFQPYSGITSTPHISLDPSTQDGILYVVDKAFPISDAQGPIQCEKGTTDDSVFNPPATTFFRIWSIDLNKLGTPAQIHLPPLSIQSTHLVPGIRFNNGAPFDPLYEDQRPGLLVWNDASIYVGFAASPSDFQTPLPTDKPPGNGTGKGTTTWHGWLMKFSTALTPKGQPLQTWMSTNSSSGKGGGIGKEETASPLRRINRKSWWRQATGRTKL